MYCDFITIIIICFSRSPCMVRINKVNGKGDVGGVRAVKTLPYLVEHGLRTHHNNGRRRQSKRSYFNVGKHTLKNTNISTVKPMFYPQNTHTHTHAHKINYLQSGNRTEKFTRNMFLRNSSFLTFFDNHSGVIAFAFESGPRSISRIKAGSIECAPTGTLRGNGGSRDRKTFSGEPNLPRISNTQKITNKSRIDGYPSLISLATTDAVGRNCWRPWRFRDDGKKQIQTLHTYI